MSAGTGGKPQERSTPPAGGGEAEERFAVPTELLRLAGDHEAAPPPASPRLRSSPPGRPVPPTPAVRVSDGVVGDAVLPALGTAVTLATLFAERACGHRIERSLHIGTTGIGGLLVVAAGAALAGAPFMGWLADRAGRRRVAGAAIGVAAVIGALAGAAPSMAWLALATAAMGASVAGQATGIVGDLGDRYPEGARGRVLAVYALALPAGAAGAAALAVVAAATGSWRWAMVVSLAGVPVGAAVWRQARRAPVAGDRAQGLGPTAQRLRRLRSLAGLAAAGSALGLLLIGVPLVAATYLQHHWRQQLGGRAALVLIAALGAVVGAPLAGWWGDRAADHGGDRAAIVVAGALAVVGGGLSAAAYLPVLGLVEVAWVLTVAAAAVAGVAIAQWAMAVVPVADRSTALGILAGYGLVGGGVVGTVVLTAFSHADGSRLALALAAVAFVAAGLGAWLARDGARSDAAAIAAEGADSSPAGGRPGGAARPALVVRGVDFSYGARQVLFGVDMGVEEGEAAALLGTNGAGKSTLLRLVAGLDHPSAGSIRIWGRDSTYLEAEQVVGLGVGLLPGGRMSFPGLTVMENLRVGGHTLRRQGARLQAAIDEVMGLFPVLAERRDQRVGTLSGGEQQMLALARVLLTRPRLLVIDELSLGLAPKAVESLLAVVRRLNQDGTTVLLVEQSVNLALSLADHALFLERGEVRFDGRTADLLARDDLLRPVFLGAGR